MSKSLVERYGLDPAVIEELSFAIIEERIPYLLPADPAARAVYKRIIHTTGDPQLAAEIRVSPGAVAAGVAALRRGAPILTDVQMVAAGVNSSLAARLGCTLTSMIADPRVPDRARAEQTTRAVAAVRLHAGALDGAVVAIGNAPTALLALLDLVDAGQCRPALIVGMPVGFVNTAEAKAELMERLIPYITIPGTRGGSPVAAATVNALLKVAAEQTESEAGPV